jgi:hypothetical protein
MNKRITTVMSALVIGLATLPAAARAQLVCGDRGTVVSGLEKNFSEAPVSMGLSSNGSIIEIFASPDKTWTIVMTKPDGMSCVLMAGEDWESLPTQLAGIGT